MSHTPGPWSNERIWDTPASRIHARVDGIPVALAEVFTMHSAGEKEANARLIAAAPELLEALVEVENLAAIGDIEEDTEALGWGAWIKKARAAIAKATSSPPAHTSEQAKP